jgi:hypothetical protein
LAEKAARENRHGMDRHALISGDNIRRERKFAGIELEILQEPFVAALARIDFQEFKFEFRIADGAFQERPVSIVGTKCYFYARLHRVSALPLLAEFSYQSGFYTS